MKPSFKRIAQILIGERRRTTRMFLDCLKKLRGLIFNDKIMEIILGNQIGA